MHFDHGQRKNLVNMLKNSKALDKYQRGLVPGYQEFTSKTTSPTRLPIIPIVTTLKSKIPESLLNAISIIENDQDSVDIDELYRLIKSRPSIISLISKLVIKLDNHSTALTRNNNNYYHYFNYSNKNNKNFHRQKRSLNYQQL